MKTLLAFAAAALLCAATAAAAGQTVDVPTLAAKQLAQIKHKTSVPVLLPQNLAVLDKNKVYSAGSATATTWNLELDFAPNCGSATACFLADFQAEHGTLPGASNAKLAGGDPAFYHPSTCGGSCSPYSIYFVHAGVLYSFQDSDLSAKSAKAFMLALANAAVAAGPR